MIAIINYGSGNVQAIANIYHKLGVDFVITDQVDDLVRADKLVLPGVGAFDEVMQQLNASGMRDTLDRLVLQEKKPVIGVCVGMQILADSSEEGVIAGLGYVSGRVRKLDATKMVHKPHLPHMGWNTVTPALAHPLLDGLDLDLGFYFLHSYYFECSNPQNALTTTNYGSDFVSAVYNQNVFGTQFHPEKSHSNGIKIFQNFANLTLPC
jgi:imidazole glycerol-phosphate synthase subunit HisH